MWHVDVDMTDVVYLAHKRASRHLDVSCRHLNTVSAYKHQRTRSDGKYKRGGLSEPESQYRKYEELTQVISKSINYIRVLREAIAGLA